MMGIPINKQAMPSSIQKNPRLGQWLGINSDGKIAIYSGKVELGQGIRASLIKIACVQLGINPSQLLFTAGDTSNCPDELYTAGSQSIEVGGLSLAFACNEFRRLFTQMAAKYLCVEDAKIVVKDGKFYGDNPVRSVSYSDLSDQVSYLDHQLDQFWSGQAFNLINHCPDSDSYRRDDILKKISSGAYVHDLELPKMLHARILRGRHYLAIPKHVQEEIIRALKGVEIFFRSGNFIAILGKNEAHLVEAYKKAEDLIEWVITDALPRECESKNLLPKLPSISSLPIAVGTKSEVALNHTAQYSRPYLAHAAIGPACALAKPSCDDDPLTVWSHTQGSHFLGRQIAKALDLSEDKVRIIHHPGPGCYGHNSADDVSFDAALLAHKLNLPVRVQWMRQDEMCVSPLGSPGLVKLQAGFSKDGEIASWMAEVWSPTHISRPGWGEGVNLLGAWSIDPPFSKPPTSDPALPAGGGLRNIRPYYDIPSLEVHHHFISDSPLRTSALRSLGAHVNIFAIESFIEELAEIAKVDSIEFRLRHLNDVRAIDCIQSVARIANWAERKTGLQEKQEAHGLGVGFARYKNSSAYCAVVIEVQIENEIRVSHVWIAADAGAIIHRDALLNQIEGGVVQALSWSLKEQIFWDEGGITSKSWDEYPILNFDEVPELTVELIEGSTDISLGSGELACGPVAAALANAVSHALGIRARHLPLTPDRLTALINESA